MDGPVKPGPPFWIASTDDQGRAIPPDLIEAARRFWPQALYLLRRELGDSDGAAEILESAVFAMARVARQNGQPRKIENPYEYLNKAFCRRLARRIARDRFIQNVDSAELLEYPGRAEKSWFGLTPAELELLVKQLEGYMDSRTQMIFFLRAEGYSWDEIAGHLAVSRNAVTVDFHRGLLRARRRILREARPGHRSLAARNS